MSDIKDRLKFNSGTDKVTKSVADAVSEVLNSGQPLKSRFELTQNLWDILHRTNQKLQNRSIKNLQELVKQ